VLCYLWDDRGRLLLLHRRKNPNRGMYSPIGGKLEVAVGESPHDCAVREIREEAGIELATADLGLLGLVSETAYEGQTHWLIFLFEVTRTVRPEEVVDMHMDEGHLEWVPVEEVEGLDIPETDRTVMWPLVQAHRGGFFAVHIDCTGGRLEWEVRESMKKGTEGLRQ
jgi:8-oxo-dGTP diphosphatase